MELLFSLTYAWSRTSSFYLSQVLFLYVGIELYYGSYEYSIESYEIADKYVTISHIPQDGLKRLYNLLHKRHGMPQG